MTAPVDLNQIVTNLELALRPLDDPAERAQRIREAMLKGVKLALAEPSKEMAREGAVAAMLKWNSDATECWSAMSAVRLRELGVEE